MFILGIETSCDETAAAIVSAERRILSNVVRSQFAAHEAFGGVVPEIAAREHVVHIRPVVEQALKEANLQLSDLSGIAATGGPGLIGGVMVGVMAAKAMAAAAGKAFIAVNHLEGHALTARLTDDIAFPYLLLLMSGGHCQILMVHTLGQYEILGGTRDDALGEAYDKVAKMLGLGFPGGPAVEAIAKQGNPNAFVFPKAFMGDGGYDFSFSGLKTAVMRQILLEITRSHAADICASFQHTASEILQDRTRNAIALFKAKYGKGPVVAAGGVAANQYLRASLEKLCTDEGMYFVVPPMKLCTDNAAMIAWAGLENLRAGNSSSMAFSPRPRWPLIETHIA